MTPGNAAGAAETSVPGELASARWSRVAPDELSADASGKSPLRRLEALSDPERVGTLRTSGLLDREAEGAFDRITGLARRLLGVSTATVTLLDDQWQHFNSAVPRDTPLTRAGAMPASGSFCQHVVATGERLLVQDARTNLLVRDSPAIAGQDVIAYAGAPLTTSEGHVLGALCAVEDEPRAWHESEVELLRELAALAATEIDYRLGLLRIRQAEPLVRQLAEPVETLGDAIGSVATIAHQVQAPPRLVRFAELAQSRFRAVEALERELTELVPAARGADGTLRVIDLVERVERAARISSITARKQDLSLRVPPDRILVSVDSYALDRALSHLFVTTLSHGEDADGVEATLEPREGQAWLNVRSPGHPIPTTDLTTLVSRLSKVAAPDEPDAALSRDACSIRRSGRTTVAETRRVRATTDPDGTHVTVRFRLAAPAS